MGECSCGVPHDWQRIESGTYLEDVFYTVYNGTDLIHRRMLPLDLERVIEARGAEKALNDLKRMAEQRTLQVILDGGYVDLEDIDAMLAAMQSGQWSQEGDTND